MTNLRLPGAVLGLAGLLAATSPLVAQKTPVTRPLVTAAMAGQSIALLPITMVLVDPEIQDSSLPHDRAALLLVADSLIEEAIVARAPELTWVMPKALRHMARRSGGLIGDPDQMGQALMRNWGLKTVPDPLRSNLRKLLAVAGGRYVFIPASLVIRPDSAGTGLAGDLSAVLADVRTGKVVWRSLAKGEGSTPAAVVTHAIETIFPPEGTW